MLRRHARYPGYPGFPTLAPGVDALDQTAPLETFRFGLAGPAHIGSLAIGSTVLLMDVTCGRPAAFVLAQDAVPADAPTCRRCIALVEGAMNWQGQSPRWSAVAELGAA